MVTFKGLYLKFMNSRRSNRNAILIFVFIALLITLYNGKTSNSNSLTHETSFPIAESFKMINKILNEEEKNLDFKTTSSSKTNATNLEGISINTMIKLNQFKRFDNLYNMTSKINNTIHKKSLSKNSRNNLQNLLQYLDKVKRLKNITNLQLNVSGKELQKSFNQHRKKLCFIPPLRTVISFFDYEKRISRLKCDNLFEMGGDLNGDGSKFVCFDDKYKIDPLNCVVLSFGINNEWSFDDAMDSYGCQVYSFDPTMGVGNFDRSPRIHFYNLGLSNVTGKAPINGTLYPMARYEDIITMLNLTNKPIDYLKLDIEGSEVEFFSDIFENSPHLLEKVKQISIEMHPLYDVFLENEEAISKSVFYKLWEGMHRLQCHGFYLLHTEMNRKPENQYKLMGRTLACCYEYVWARVAV